MKQLLGNRILARRVIRDANPGSKIILPDILKDDNNTGGPKEWEVLAVGPGRTNPRTGVVHPIECSPGDRIVCHSWTTGAIEYKDGTFILDADMIMCVFPKTPV